MGRFAILGQVSSLGVGFLPLIKLEEGDSAERLVEYPPECLQTNHLFRAATGLGGRLFLFDDGFLRSSPLLHCGLFLHYLFLLDRSGLGRSTLAFSGLFFGCCDLLGCYLFLLGGLLGRGGFFLGRSLFPDALLGSLLTHSADPTWDTR